MPCLAGNEFIRARKYIYRSHGFCLSPTCALRAPFWTPVPGPYIILMRVTPTENHTIHQQSRPRSSLHQTIFARGKRYPGPPVELDGFRLLFICTHFPPLVCCPSSTQAFLCGNLHFSFTDEHIHVRFRNRCKRAAMALLSHKPLKKKTIVLVSHPATNQQWLRGVCFYDGDHAC